MIHALLLLSSLSASPADAVVIVDGCTGVCVHPAGLVMTVKHCTDLDDIQITFAGRKPVHARCVYRCKEADGPQVFDCDGAGYPFVAVAAAVPQTGSRVWSIGLPGDKPRPTSRDGVLAGGAMLNVGAMGVPINLVSFPIESGWSGGPLFNGRNEVVGLAVTTDPRRRESQWISWAATRRAYDAAVASLKTALDKSAPTNLVEMVIFTATDCPPCVRLHSDCDARRADLARFAVIFESDPAALAAAGITKIPTTVVNGLRIEGYDDWGAWLQSVNDAAKTKSDRGEVLISFRNVAPVSEPPSPFAPVSPLQPIPDPKFAHATPSPTPSPRVAPSVSERVDKVAGILGTGLTIAQIITGGAITVGTGGIGGLALWGGLAAVRAIAGSGRTRPRWDARPPPAGPTVVTVDTPPPPQQIIRETQFAPYERDTHSEAYAWAKTEMARKYPGAVGALETLDSMMQQFLAAKQATAT